MVECKVRCWSVRTDYSSYVSRSRVGELQYLGGVLECLIEELSCNIVLPESSKRYTVLEWKMPRNAKKGTGTNCSSERARRSATFPRRPPLEASVVQ